jgi:hypothetical protein
VNSPRLKGHAANTFGLLSLRHSPLVIPPNQRSRFLTRFCSPAAPPAQTVDQADSALANPFHHVFDVVDDEVGRPRGISGAVGSQRGGRNVGANHAAESRMAASCLSVRVLECGLKAWALEWVATSGASLMAATSQNPRSLMCERSIRIPSRSHRRTSSLPRSVRPGPVSGDEGQRNRNLNQALESGMSKSPAPMTDPDAPVKLDASSKSSLAGSIRALALGQQGWISMKEAAGLFSAKHPDYAFGETDDDGNRNLASFAATIPRHRYNFMPVEGVPSRSW